MRDGLYKVVFQTPLGAGAGVLLLKDGRLWGGDSGMYYVGNYKHEGQKFTGKITVNRHTREAGYPSVFGIDKVTVTLTGTGSDDSGSVEGTAAEVPGIQFQALFSRISD